jgi:CHAT domain-containing protein/tetratricopeptide (TPR) repeat protein
MIAMRVLMAATVAATLWASFTQAASDPHLAGETPDSNASTTPAIPTAAMSTPAEAQAPASPAPIASAEDSIAEGRRLFEDRQMDRAIAVVREAAARAGEQRDPEIRAQALFWLGRIAVDRDRRIEARRTYEEALQLFAEAGDRAGGALALAASGGNLYSLGERPEALRRLNEACDMLRALGDTERLAQATTWLMIVMDSGAAKDRAREDAFTLARAAKSREYECSLLQSWGNDLFRAGQLGDAYRTIKQAASCYEAMPRQGRLARVLIVSGDLERVHGQFDTALASYQRAVELARRNDDPLGVAAALNAIGMTHASQFRMDEARASFEEALSISRATGADIYTPYLIGQLGAHLMQQQRYAEAIPLLKESLAQEQDARFQIDRLSQLGNAYARTGDLQAALEPCDRAVALARQEGDAYLMHALRWRGEARRLAGDVDGAAVDLREGIAVTEAMRGKTVPVDFMKRGFSEWHQWLFGSLIALLSQKGEINDALETAERARARAFLDLLATRDLTSPAMTLAPGAATNQIDAPSTTTSGAAPAPEAAPRVPRGATTARRPPTSAARMQKRGASDSTTARNAEDAAAPTGSGAREELADLANTENAAAATVPEMIATARRLRSTLLVYWVELDTTYIWVITPTGRVHQQRVEVALPRLTSLAAATRTPAADSGAGLFALTSAAARRPWRELHDLLIAPVRRYLPTTPDALLTIVPHGPLFQVSFAALQDERGRYLLERYRLHYTPAVGVLSYTARRKRLASESRNGSALLVGDPGELPGESADAPPLAALPWARREVSEVATLLARYQPAPTVLLDAQASESAVRAHLAGHSLLHFAIHAIVRQNESLSSFLALRGDGNGNGDGDGDGRNGATPASDGRLTANEVYALHLDGDLVVLSACSSALGPLTGDGVIGFTRAFLYAGAPSVIATEWDVPDAAGYELMRRFYRARRTTPDPSRALRAAQLATLAALRTKSLTIPSPGPDAQTTAQTPVALPEHPLFWAGFILVGEP